MIMSSTAPLPSNIRMNKLLRIARVAVELWRRATTLPNLVQAPKNCVDRMPMTMTMTIYNDDGAT